MKAEEFLSKKQDDYHFEHGHYALCDKNVIEWCEAYAEQENKEMRELLTRLLNDSMCSVVGEELIEQALKR
jgi:uncharacterized Zn ribbon protein